ncbi:LacI family DNA-binding transcriptional regulator [Sphaerotilus montanus]|uniref:LacI family DNA-binding transcriptional regulator n=1 Tax=Sphaerotilus montanus TaxID=522889 RepID=UPI003FA2FF70
MTHQPDPPPAERPERQRLQMTDIARIAGVSVATVSRALNGSAEVSAATRQRISELARSLNYTINVGAKNLRLRHNKTVSVVIPYDRRSRQHVSDPFFLAMLGSLADALTDRGFDMLVSRVDADRLELAAQAWDTGTAMGVVLIGQWHRHEQINQLAERGVPLVVWGAQIPVQRYCSVGGDNATGGALATQHLLEQGCQRIVFMGDPDLPEVARRLRGHRQALAEAERETEPTLELHTPFDANQARADLSRLIESGTGFDAVFACSDVLAMAVVQVLRAHGKEVPRDVAVVGYDDIEWASHAYPPLTTVRQPVSVAGIEIVDALLAIVAGEVVPPRTLPVELVVRRSSLR